MLANQKSANIKIQKCYALGLYSHCAVHCISCCTERGTKAKSNCKKTFAYLDAEILELNWNG